MTGKEFLARLEAALMTLPYEERQNAIRYYEEYILDAGEENEAEAVAELGGPEPLAEKIIRESRAYAKDAAGAQPAQGGDGDKALAPFKRIELDLLNATVVLYKAEAYAIALDFPDEYPLPTVEVRDNTLFVKEKRHTSFVFFGIRSFGFMKKSEVRIALPDAQYERFSFDMTNGSLNVPKLCVRELNAKNVNGLISVEGVSGERVHLESVNGRINASGVSTSEKCHCETVNGGIELSGTLRGKVNAEAVNGGIRVRMPLSGKDYDIALETLSGSVRVNGQKMGKSFRLKTGAPNSVRAKTVNGGIQLELESGTIVL